MQGAIIPVNENKGGFIPLPLDVLPTKELTPISKMVFALIQYREHGQYGACVESAGSMANMLGVGEKTIRRAIEDLFTGGYITKICKNGAGWRLNTTDKVTAVNMTAVNMTAVTLTETAVTLSKNRGQNDRQIKENIKEYKNKGDKSPTRKKRVSFSPFSSLPDGEVKEALMEYAKVRKGGKSPIKTERQEKLLLDKLKELAPNDRAKQVKIINEAIMRGWLSFYPLGEDKAKPSETRRNNDSWSNGIKTRIV